MSGHAVFTGDASHLFREMDKVQRRFDDFEKSVNKMMNDFNQKTIKIKTTLDSDEARKQVQQLAKDAAKELATHAPKLAVQIDKSSLAAARTLEIQSRANLTAQKALSLEEKRLQSIARAEMQKTATVRKKADDEAQKAMREQRQLGSQMSREIEAGFRRSGISVNRFGDVTKTVTGHLRDMEAQMHRIESARKDAFDKLSNASTIAGGAILGGAVFSAKQFIDFDKQLRNVNSIAQLSEQSLQGVSSAVLKLSSDPNIKKGPRDLVESLYTIYSSGKTGTEALGILKDAALGASAGMTTTDTSAKVLLATLNSGIGGVNNSREAMNVLFKIVDRGVLSFEQLSGTIGEVLPTAQAAGIPLQELGAAIAVMTKNGENAGMASNDLLNLITKLIRPPKEAKGAFDALGISYGTSALKAKGLGGILAEIEAKTHGNRDALSKLLPDMQAYRAALILLKNHGADYRGELVQMNKAQEDNGALMKAAQKQNQGVSNSWQQLIKDAEILSIKMQRSLAPSLQEVLDDARKGIEWFDGLSQSTKDNTVKVGLFGGALLILIPKIRDVYELIKLIKEAHFAAGAAAGVQATAEELAAARSATAWATASGKILSSFGLISRAGIIAGSGLALGSGIYEASRRAGLQGPNAPGSLGEAWSNAGETAKIGAQHYAFTVGTLGQGDWQNEMRGQMADRALNQFRQQMAKSLAQRLAVADAMYRNAGSSSLYRADTAALVKPSAPPKPPADPLANYGRGKSEGERAAEKAHREAARRAKEAMQATEKAQRAAWDKQQGILREMSQTYSDQADAVEKSAQRQIEAYKNLSETIGEVMGSAQERLRDKGVTGNPLGGYARALTDFFNLEKSAQGVAAHYGKVAGELRQTAADLQKQASQKKPVFSTSLIPVKGGTGKLAPANPFQFATVGGTSSGVNNESAKAIESLKELFAGMGIGSIRDLPKGWGKEYDVTSSDAEKHYTGLALQKILQSEKAPELLNLASKTIAAPGALTGLEKRLNIKFDLQGDTREDVAANFLHQLANAMDYAANRALALKTGVDDITSALKNMQATGPEMADSFKFTVPAIRKQNLLHQMAQLDFSPTNHALPIGNLSTIAKSRNSIESYFTNAQKAADSIAATFDARGGVATYKIKKGVADILGGFTDALKQGEAQLSSAMNEVEAIANNANEVQRLHDKMQQDLSDMKYVGRGADQLGMWRELLANPLLNDSGRLEIFNQQKHQQAAREMRDLWVSSLQEISGELVNFDNGLSGIVDSIVSSLDRMAREFLSRKIFESLAGLFGFKTQYTPGFAGNAGVPDISGAAFGADGSVGRNLPSYAVGAYRINRDQIAAVHAGEMVVPANAAEMLRQGNDLATAWPTAAVSNTSSNEVHYHDHGTRHYNISGAQNPQATARAIQMQERTSTSEVILKARKTLRKG